MYLVDRKLAHCFAFTWMLKYASLYDFRGWTKVLEPSATPSASSEATTTPACPAKASATASETPTSSASLHKLETHACQRSWSRSSKLTCIRRPALYLLPGGTVYGTLPAFLCMSVPEFGAGALHKPQSGVRQCNASAAGTHTHTRTYQRTYANHRCVLTVCSRSKGPAVVGLVCATSNLQQPMLHRVH